MYQPRLRSPALPPEGYEISVATNDLGHFLLSLLPADLRAMVRGPRLMTLGTVTANSEEFGRQVPSPAPASPGDRSG